MSPLLESPRTIESLNSDNIFWGGNKRKEHETAIVPVMFHIRIATERRIIFEPNLEGWIMDRLNVSRRNANAPQSSGLEKLRQRDGEFKG